MQAVHVLTHFKTTFGVLDAEGNVIMKEVMEGEIDRLHPHSFMEALKALISRKMQIQARLDSAERNTKPTNEISSVQRDTKPNETPPGATGR